MAQRINLAARNIKFMHFLSFTRFKLKISVTEQKISSL